MNRFTFNFNCTEIGDLEGAKDFIKHSTSRYVYLLNPTEQLIDLALANNKRVVARIFDPFRDYRPGNSFDGKFHTLHSPFATFSYLKSFFGKYRSKEVYFIVGYNEPSNDDMPNQFKWFVDFGTFCVKDGFKVALGGWNTSKSIRANESGQCFDIDNGVWDPILEFASRYRRHVILDFHDYTMGKITGQQIGGYPNNLFDPVKMRQRPRPLLWNSRNLMGQWHIGRHAPLVNRAVEKGYTVRFGIGECFWDLMGDLGGAFHDKFRATYGMPQFDNEISGLRSLFKYYSAISQKQGYNYEDFAKDAMEELEWVDSQYPHMFEYFAMFAYNRNYMWSKFDFSVPEMRPFVNRVRNYINIPNGESLVNMKPATVINNTKFKRLIRSQPNIQAPTIDYLGEDRTTKIDADNLIISGDFAWLKMITSDDRIGYVAVYNVKNPSDVYVVWNLHSESPIQPVPPESPVPIGFINFEVTVEYGEMKNIVSHLLAKNEDPYIPDSLKRLNKALADYVSALMTKSPDELVKYGGLLITSKEE